MKKIPLLLCILMIGCSLCLLTGCGCEISSSQNKVKIIGIQFDLPTTPDNCIVSSCEIRVKGIGETNNVLIFHRNNMDYAVQRSESVSTQDDLTPSHSNTFSVSSDEFELSVHLLVVFAGQDFVVEGSAIIQIVFGDNNSIKFKNPDYPVYVLKTLELFWSQNGVSGQIDLILKGERA